MMDEKEACGRERPSSLLTAVMSPSQVMISCVSRSTCSELADPVTY